MARVCEADVRVRDTSRFHTSFGKGFIKGVPPTSACHFPTAPTPLTTHQHPLPARGEPAAVSAAVRGRATAAARRATAAAAALN